MSLRATVGSVAISSLKVGLMNQTPTAFFMGLPRRCAPRKKRGQATFSDVLSTNRDCPLSYRKSSLSPFFNKLQSDYLNKLQR